MTTKRKNKGGRPKLEIDWDLAGQLCELHCTGEEIAGVLGVSYDTLERNIRQNFGTGFAEYFAQKSAGGKISLRRRQFEAAESGNVTMLIWLGKQLLNQKERASVDTTSSDGSMSPVKERDPVEYAREVAKATDEILRKYHGIDEKAI